MVAITRVRQSGLHELGESREGAERGTEGDPRRLEASEHR